MHSCRGSRHSTDVFTWNFYRDSLRSSSRDSFRNSFWDSFRNCSWCSFMNSSKDSFRNCSWGFFMNSSKNSFRYHSRRYSSGFFDRILWLKTRNIFSDSFRNSFSDQEFFSRLLKKVLLELHRRFHLGFLRNSRWGSVTILAGILSRISPGIFFRDSSQAC